MKLHKIFLFAAVALTSVFASCSDDENVNVTGEQDSTNKPFAYMSSDNQLSYELDPAAATEITFKVCRTNTSAAAEVPLNVAVNTDNVFNVPATASFAAGDSEANVTVTFPQAEVGTAYTLKVGFTEEYAGVYKDVVREQAFTVTRVKWNDLGTAYLIDDFWYGDTYEVALQQRDDNKLSYRFVSPYTDEVTGGGGTYQQYITVTTTKAGGVSFGSFYFNTLYDVGQEIIAWFPSELSSSVAAYDEYSYVEKNEDGTINYIVLAPYWYISGVGGWSPKSGYNLYLVFPGQSGPASGEEGE